MLAWVHVLCSKGKKHRMKPRNFHGCVSMASCWDKKLDKHRKVLSTHLQDIVTEINLAGDSGGCSNDNPSVQDTPLWKRKYGTRLHPSNHTARAGSHCHDAKRDGTLRSPLFAHHF